MKILLELIPKKIVNYMKFSICNKNKKYNFKNKKYNFKNFIII